MYRTELRRSPDLCGQGQGNLLLWTGCPELPLPRHLGLPGALARACQEEHRPDLGLLNARDEKSSDRQVKVTLVHADLAGLEPQGPSTGFRCFAFCKCPGCEVTFWLFPPPTLACLAQELPMRIKKMTSELHYLSLTQQLWPDQALLQPPRCQVSGHGGPV